MASYYVLESPETDGMGRPADAVLIRDGFSVIAFIAPFLWFLFHRMWFEALLVFGAFTLLAMLSLVPGLDFFSVLGIIVCLFCGLEAQNLWATWLRRRGWRDWGIVVGANRDEAELRYLSALAAEGDEDGTAGLTVPRETASQTGPWSDGSQFGLIDYPRKA